MLRKDLPVVIRHHREQALMSQVELAQKAGVTTKTIWAIESGINVPMFRTVRKIAEVLNLVADDLISDDLYKEAYPSVARGKR